MRSPRRQYPCKGRLCGWTAILHIAMTDLAPITTLPSSATLTRRAFSVRRAITAPAIARSERSATPFHCSTIQAIPPKQRSTLSPDFMVKPRLWSVSAWPSRYLAENFSHYFSVLFLIDGNNKREQQTRPIGLKDTPGKMPHSQSTLPHQGGSKGGTPFGVGKCRGSAPPSPPAVTLRTPCSSQSPLAISRICRHRSGRMRKGGGVP